MTFAPFGTSTPAPTALTFPPSTTMVWFGAAVPASGSMSRPARMTVVCPTACADEAARMKECEEVTFHLRVSRL